eukprot:gene4386-2011_t
MAGEGHKLHELQEVARALQIPVIFVTESHLDPSFADGEIEMPGYEILRQDRPGLLEPARGKRGRSKRVGLHRRGGVLAYVAEGIKVCDATSHTGDGYEMLAFALRGTDTRYILLYRTCPKSGPVGSVPDSLLEELENEVLRSPNPIVVGDLNMDYRDKYPKPRRLLHTLQQKLQLDQQVQFITRYKTDANVRTGKGSTIDHVWAKRSCRCGPLTQLNGMSDHEAVIATHALGATVKPRTRQVVRLRRWRRAEVQPMLDIIDECMRSSARGLVPHEPTHARIEMQRRG